MVSAENHNGCPNNRIADLEIQVSRLQDIESRLLKNERNLKDAERLAQLGHWDLDIANNILTWSDEIYRIFEIDSSSFGATYEAFLTTIHPDDRDMVNNAYTKSLENREPYNINHRLKMPDGRVKFVVEHCETHYDEDGNPTHSLGTVHDVTERVHRQEEHIQAVKMQAVGTLAGGIAHDFNNLLVAIMGNLELAMEGLQGQSEVLELVNNAHKAATRSRDISRQLLTLATGGDPLCQSTDLTTVIRDAVDFFSSGTSVEVDCVIEDDLWPAHIDSGQVSQVLQNLILNAIEAMDRHGLIKITCANCLITIDGNLPLPSGRYIEITISDSGPGMPEEVAAKVFEPYFTTGKNGSGLGLSMVRSIISKHGGHIGLTTSPGKGTIFVVTLPASDKAVQPKQTSVLSPVQALRILVLDDEMVVGAMTVKMATKIGHQAFHLASCDEAVTAFQQAMEDGDPFDLVVLDLTMPGDKGGLWVLAELKKLAPEVKALVSSGYCTDIDISRYSEYGFVGSLPKPFNIAEMQEAFESALQFPG